MADIFYPGMRDWLAALNQLAKGQLQPIQVDWNAMPGSIKAILNKPTLAAVATTGKKADVGLGKVDDTSDADKPVSTAQAKALAEKASLAGATFTGPVVGISKAMIGLDNVDNTSDANKPLSAAQAAVLGLRNRIDNGNFVVNQRAVSGTVTLAPGAYGHDRWRAGAGGCTYTFSRAQGIVTLTISAGSLLQVIDGVSSLQGTNNYVTSWVGTAMGRYGANAYAPSGFFITLVADSGPYLEFGIGTLSRVQVELGTVATPYEVRNYADELARCRSYYVVKVFPHNTPAGIGQAFTTGQAYIQVSMTETMRTPPTVSITGNFARLGGEVVSAPAGIGYGPAGVSFSVTWSSTPFVAGNAVLLAATGTVTISLSSDL